MSSRMVFCMSGLHLSVREDTSEEELSATVASLPEKAVRDMLMQASLRHPDVYREVMTGKPQVMTGRPQAPKDALRRHSLPSPSSPMTSSPPRPARRSVEIAGHTLDVDYYSSKAATALTMPGPRRQESLLSLCNEIRVLIDLQHGDFAMKAIFALLPVLGEPDKMEPAVWREVTSFEGPMLKLSHLLQRAIRCCSAEQCREFMEPLSAACRHLEGHGISVFTPQYAALKKKCFYTGSVRG